MLIIVPGGPINVIASAVTPAVMISASAILISGVSAKHSSMADRLRSLGTEYRDSATPAERRVNIQKQYAVFMRRLRLIALSHMLLYSATCVFSLMVIVISLITWDARWNRVLFPLFLLGVLMLIASSVLEILELHLGNRVLLLDVTDTIHRDQA